MNAEVRRLRRTTRSTALCTLAALLFAPYAALAFNPNEGAESTAPIARTRTRLPSTAPLIAPMPKLSFPEYTAPAGTTARQVPVENENASGLPPIQLTAPSQAAYPPVDAATATRAAQEMQVGDVPPMPPAVISQPNTGFIAPAPLATTQPLPEPLADPSALTAPIPPMPMAALPAEQIPYAPEQLSEDSKKILSKIPSRIDTPKSSKGGKLGISRMSPELQTLAKEPKVDTFDAAGISIKVRRSGLDTGFELNRAYTALMGGETTQAIEIYKNILSTEPKNQDALFALGAIHQRQGEIEKARPYYSQLLEVNPNHREGLNNFLALISDESPQEALAELGRLEDRNPDFSPIPAQQAVLLGKLGYFDEACNKMLRAMELAPENLTYKYNLAVMLDRHGNYVDAANIYRQLISASLRGESIPATTETLQKRLNFIATAATSLGTAGS